MRRAKLMAGLMLMAATSAMADAMPTEQALGGNWDCEFAFKVGDKFSVNFSAGKFALKLKSETIDGTLSLSDSGLQLKPTDAGKAAQVGEYLPAKVFQYTAPAELVLGDGNPETYCTRK